MVDPQKWVACSAEGIPKFVDPRSGLRRTHHRFACGTAQQTKYQTLGKSALGSPPPAYHLGRQYGACVSRDGNFVSSKDNAGQLQCGAPNALFTADMHSIHTLLGRLHGKRRTANRSLTVSLSSFLFTQGFVWGRRSASARLCANSSNRSSSTRDLPAPHRK
ncbi:hypothetical protein HBH98_057870 [Parastagonospora nodorum]|nr:hypothetical protein HBH53_131470 [Parastagonospora nodorum]KAH4349859.1 hypothetical protein HBH98_057870 [Parastagonospora nodorum]KAH4394929.1 hypothetical protein HBH97_025690 [Parastagonospora nodorum]KAH4418655.1 hypothetical protein HBH99_060130 [Parastagonospora nodorum]KAH4903969.1 hypothetical protein HBI80_111380 [Parastagonospora nodorum]